ncbi:cytoskeleton associated protein, putative [Plasmodium yoelii]|uniref:Cytoskeleton associated protein n=2 Tax=Plasmodium yoelii TaxID=5861 RepID=A0AAE9WU12_PLAYO|nr:cytoskeleton associated protein, putative [Plasmodium yoelii]WBY56584.1 cytoskeleton associated protein [Plasmodium yoelii yoelii]CDU17443.1 cytoskeleton associated protein, putative [Plasmodium yoelii]VTZ77162.1 cytoskeleton associated protein, putative [Plasmodium yoelii]|eukprot:XP_022811907.1 cytoskeleton associated protein, putative [Plasmodium yoelii]
MENIFNNPKNLNIGSRIFSCNFRASEKTSSENDENIDSKKKKMVNGNGVNNSNINEDNTDDENADKNLKMYLFNENIKVKIGTIRFIGQLKNHPNKYQTYYGVEWDNEYDGKNAGCFDNEFYFFPLHFLKKNNPNIYYKYNKDKHLIHRNVDDLKMYVKSFLCENANHAIKPCSFMSLNNIHVGITFIQALNFRYNYFPDLDLSIEDYQTKKVKKVIFSGEEKVCNYFKNFENLNNITLNKCLIYTTGFINNLYFHNLESLSLSNNLFCQWIDIFKIIQIAKKLSYLNLSQNIFTKLTLESLLLSSLYDDTKITKIETIQGDNNNNNNDTNPMANAKNINLDHNNSDLIYFNNIKELCLDNTLIDWDDVLILSFVFPNLETLSLKNNYIRNIKINNLSIKKNSIIYKYITNDKYVSIFYPDLVNSKKNCSGDYSTGFNSVSNTNTHYNEVKLNEINRSSDDVGPNLNDYIEKSMKTVCCENINKTNDTTKNNSYDINFSNENTSNSSSDEEGECEHIKIDLLKNLRKIVLNDNYLYSYEELFYFIYKIKHIESIYLNNNKFNDNSNLINIAYNMCIQKEKQNPQDISVNNGNTQSIGHSTFDVINKNFSHIKEFLFDNNEINNYETFRDLFYVLYNIEILKLQNYKFMEKKKSLRYILISIMPNLKVLNYSCINKNERINSERFFISLYQRDPIAKIFNEPVLNRKHSDRLEKMHYKATEDQGTIEKSKSMQGNVINIQIIPEFINSQKFNIIKKKVNKNMSIKDLKYLCSRLYSIPITKIKMFYTDENNPLCVEITDTNSSLYTYGIEDNSKIKIQTED